MEWMNRLLRGKEPSPPQSTRSPLDWDAQVTLARSRDGRQRQAAVRALAASSHGPALPVLLERLNDWVDAVRRDARVAIDNFLRDEFLDSWTAALDDVAALARGARVDHTDTLARIAAWLSEPQRLARLRAARPTLPRAVERLLFQARMGAPDDTSQRLAAWREAFRCDDIVLAGDAAEALRLAAAGQADLDVHARPLLMSLARDALASRFSRIRLAGLRVALALQPDEGRRMARALCFDGNANARALVIGLLRNEPETMIALAAQALAGLEANRSARDRATALEALSSIDDERGLGACGELQHDPVAAVRVVALRRLLTGADAQARDSLVACALTDPSSKVRRVAVSRVHRGANPPSAESLSALCLSRPAALGSILTVATHLPPWQRFTFLMALVQRFDAATPAFALVSNQFARWCIDMQRCFLAPTTAQSAAARHAWAAGRDLLARPLHDQVAFHLRSFRVLGA